MDQKKCKKCSNEYPVTKDYFGHTPSGRFRNVCRECMRKHVAEHSAKNPHLVKARQKKRKQLKDKTAFAITNEQLAVLRDRLKDRCEYCGLKLEGKGEVEHRTPISRGGQNSIDNITLSCFLCNREKHNKTPEEFAAWRRKLGLPLYAENSSSVTWKLKQEVIISGGQNIPKSTNCFILVALLLVFSVFLAISIAN